jgi:hypothetical protein
MFSKHVACHVCADTGSETRDLQAAQTQPKEGRKKFHTLNSFEIVISWCVQIPAWVESKHQIHMY